jgi:hypothetical protein
MVKDLKIGDSAFMLTEESKEMKALSPESIGGSPVSMYVYVTDVDTIFNQATSEGATVLKPVRDQFYGDRSGYLRDPFGHLWSIATHKKDLSPDELRNAGEAFFEEMSNRRLNSGNSLAYICTFLDQFFAALVLFYVLRLISNISSVSRFCRIIFEFNLLSISLSSHSS